MDSNDRTIEDLMQLPSRRIDAKTASLILDKRAERKTMKDRDLLELAAKAAGIDFGERSQVFDKQAFFNHTWNPLTDDGDALRLAVDLGIRAGYERNAPPELNLPRECGVAAVKGQWFSEVNESDPFAATRRAIVRAAAEIGRAKESGP